MTDRIRILLDRVRTVRVFPAERDQTVSVREDAPQAIRVWNDTEITVVGGDPYLGEYEITPRAEGQILETEALYMRGDVKIKPIPYSAVSNSANGQTVTIG